MRQVVHVSDTLDSQSRGGAGYVMVHTYCPKRAGDKPLNDSQITFWTQLEDQSNVLATADDWINQLFFRNIPCDVSCDVERKKGNMLPFDFSYDSTSRDIIHWAKTLAQISGNSVEFEAKGIKVHVSKKTDLEAIIAEFRTALNTGGSEIGPAES